MPQMRIKAQVATWEGLNDHHLQDLLKLFFSESHMYLYGCFNGDTYDHLTGNFQSDKVYTIRNVEDDTESDESTVVKYSSEELNAYTLDIPYEDTAVDSEDPTSNVLSYNLVGDDKAGMFPDMDTKLVKHRSDLFLLNYKKDTEHGDTVVKAHKEALPLYHEDEFHIVTLYPYLGASECTDEMVKPSDIKKEKKLLKVGVNQQYSQSTDVKYDLYTESFSCSIKKSASSSTTIVNDLRYKIGFVPFTIEEQRKVNYGTIDLSDFISRYKLVLADENVKIDNRNTFLFYLKKDDVEPQYKMTQLLSSTQNYYNIPLSAVFPLYTDDTQIQGLVYMRLYNGDSPYVVNAGEVIEFSSFNGGENSKELQLYLEELSSEVETEDSEDSTP